LANEALEFLATALSQFQSDPYDGPRQIATVLQYSDHLGGFLSAFDEVADSVASHVTASDLNSGQEYGNVDTTLRFLAVVCSFSNAIPRPCAQLFGTNRLKFFAQTIGHALSDMNVASSQSASDTAMKVQLVTECARCLAVFWKHARSSNGDIGSLPTLVADPKSLFTNMLLLVLERDSVNDEQKGSEFLGSKLSLISVICKFYLFLNKPRSLKFLD
jgi:hypothetical protein